MKMKFAGVLFVLAAMLLLAACASEPAETQRIFTDTKAMWDELNKAFTLPRGDERTQAMNKFISDKWDEKIVSGFQNYLRVAPSGKFAKEANRLLEEAKNSQALRMLAQARPLLEQMGTGVPKTVAEAESLTARFQRENQPVNSLEIKSTPTMPGTK